MDKNTEDLEDVARKHSSKILYGYIKKLRENSQSGLIPVTDRSKATTNYIERVG